MRVVRIIIGVLLVLKGLVDVVRLPALLAIAHQRAASVAAHASAAYSGGFAVGQTVGLLVGVLILVVGGVLLIVDGWPRRQRDAVDGATA